MSSGTSSVSPVSTPTPPRLAPQPPSPQDAHHHTNYRPTPLPPSHRLNNRRRHPDPSSMHSTSVAGGATRWLSEDEGTSGNRLGTSLSDGLDTDADPAGRGQSGSGLDAAKARWKAMGGAGGGRQRMRRAVSSDRAEPTIDVGEGGSPSTITAGGLGGGRQHVNEGIPLPDIRNLTTTRMLPGGTSTFEAAPVNPPQEASATASSSRPPSQGHLTRTDPASGPSRDGQLSRTSTIEGVIPDFVEGRGGDGIGGVGLPLDTACPTEERLQEDRRTLLSKLRSILGW
jgi:hypothetical protein